MKSSSTRVPWNKGKVVSQKAPLKAKNTHCSMYRNSLASASQSRFDSARMRPAEKVAGGEAHHVHQDLRTQAGVRRETSISWSLASHRVPGLHGHHHR